MPAASVPADIPLPLPLPEPVLAVILVALFVLHIVFVNLMLGGSLLAVTFELLGLRRPGYDHLAHTIAKTITVTKSLAVVLGVGPLLAINLLYTVPFYSANRITGSVWILIVPLVTVAFLLTYLHKYTWEKLAAHKALHITIGAMATALFLVIPFIFLMNVNLMQYPDRWREAQEGGIATVLFMANVIPRYLHFLLASVAATALFLVWYLTRPSSTVLEGLPGESRATLRRRFYTIALVPTLIQFLAGPLVLLTLPPAGLSGLMLALLGVAVVLAVVVARWLWREIRDADDRPELPRRFWHIVIGLGVVVLLMATARQLYRATALRDFQAHSRQQAIDRQAKIAYYREHPPEQAPKDPREDLPGYGIFKANCMACHGLDAKLVGPPARTMGALYATPDGADAFLTWMRTTKNPRRVKAADEPPQQMPAYGPGQLDEAAVRSLHGFVVEVSRTVP